MRAFVAVLLCLLSLSSSAAERALLTVSEAMEFDAPPAKVWEVVKTFDGIAAWIPLVARCTLAEGENGRVGAIRIAELKMGLQVPEELVAYREADMTYAYALLPSPLPIDDYVATVAVRPGRDGRGSVMLWSALFRRNHYAAAPPPGEGDVDLIQALSGIYLDAMRALRVIVDGPR